MNFSIAIDFFLNVMPTVGNTASVAGFFVSLYVLFEVNKIRKNFLFKARIPQLIKALKEYAKNFSSNLQSFDNSEREIETNLSESLSTLKNLKGKVSGDSKHETKNLIKKIKKRKKPITKDDLWEIYNDLQALINSLGHLHEDTQWSQ